MKRKTIFIHGVPEIEFYEELAKRKDVKSVYVTEMRPLLFGAQIVCKELLKRKITPILICDNMVGFCLDKKMFDEMHFFAKSKSPVSLTCFAGSLIYAICAKRNKVKLFIHPAGKVKKTPKPNDIFSFLGVRVAIKGIDGYVALWEDVPLELIPKAEYESKPKR